MLKMVVLSKIFKIRGAYENVGILLSRRCIFVHWIKHYKSVNKSKANSLGVRRGLLVSARIHFLLGLGSSHVQLSENQFIILDNKYTKWQPATASNRCWTELLNWHCRFNRNDWLIRVTIGTNCMSIQRSFSHKGLICYGHGRLYRSLWTDDDH